MSHQYFGDAGVSAGGLSLAAVAASISDVLQLVILILTVVLLLFRIGNARRGKGGE